MTDEQRRAMADAIRRTREAARKVTAEEAYAQQAPSLTVRIVVENGRIRYLKEDET